MSSTRDIHPRDSARMRSHVSVLVPCRPTVRFQPAAGCASIHVCIAISQLHQRLAFFSSQKVCSIYMHVRAPWQSYVAANSHTPLATCRRDYYAKVGSLCSTSGARLCAT